MSINTVTVPSFINQVTELYTQGLKFLPLHYSAFTLLTGGEVQNQVGRCLSLPGEEIELEIKCYGSVTNLAPNSGRKCV